MRPRGLVRGLPEPGAIVQSRYNPHMGEPGNALPDVPASLQEPFRTALVAASEGWVADLGSRLVSIALFGSVARRQARPTSDIDVVLVAHDLPRALVDRRRLFLESWERVRRARTLQHIQWNLVAKSPAEAQTRSPLYLDIVE